MSATFRMEAAQLEMKLAKMSTKVGAVVLMYSATKAKQLEAYMKTHRAWTDRTNMAKAMLNAKVSQPSEGLVRITLAHGVEYGIWLELANEQNYAIIKPTIQSEGPKILEEMNDIMSRLKA